MKNILLIDADSKIPNLALMKLSRFHKNNGDNVILKRLNLSYFKKNKIRIVNTDNFDKIYCSIVFQNNKGFVKGERIEFGGSGYCLKKTLPDNIENLDPDYSIYPLNDISYGFYH